MKWIISHQSALEFWRKAHAKSNLTGKKLRIMKPQLEKLDIKELQSERLRSLAMPLHVLVGSSDARKDSRKLNCHVRSGEFPSGSFIRMDSSLIVSSPELCFVQMAGEISLIELIALGYELCGSYRLDRERADNQGFRKDLPLTNISSLSLYIEKSAGMIGRKNALKALRFIAEGSASPMETILSMLLSLPYNLGGYGFPKPLLNYRIDVPVNARKEKGQSKYYCDLYWLDKKVDVEYDSDTHHTGSDRIAEDAIRRNALTSMGVTVVSVSRRQVIEYKKTQELADVLSKLLGRRLQYTKKELILRRAKLLEKLLPKMPAEK